MSELDAIEAIAQQAALAGNERTMHGKFGWTVSPNIERSSATREKKKPAKPPSDVTPAPPPAASMRSSNGAALGQLFTDYRTLIETCRARADELQLSRSELDRLSGLPAGYSGKILGKKSVEDVSYPRKKSSKKLWPVALESMLGTLGLRILLIEDEAATARTLALRQPVDRANQRFGNVCRISAALLAPPSQPASSPPVLTVVSAKRSARGE
jgi:hypothetical protein